MAKDIGRMSLTALVVLTHCLNLAARGLEWQSCGVYRM
jgi:hypothetical protein